MAAFMASITAFMARIPAAMSAAMSALSGEEEKTVTALGA